MRHGSLSNFLFKSETKPHWNDRVKITLGIARGILYLHEDCENKIIYCDINPNNILIDENRDVKIVDFGLTKLLMPDQTRTHTGIRGTRGFVAPEWHKGQPITTKADVYIFGIVLLVIICCRPSVDVSVPEEEAILVDWVYECFMKNNWTGLMIDEEVNEKEFDRLLKIGIWYCENKIIHCDINPNNILIDENRDVKIADFGLTKLLMLDQTRTHTGIRGTRGFVAPEWHKGQPITTKVDVYIFGIVLLVIICCRPSVDVSVPEEEAILVDWVYECFMNNNWTSLMIDEEVNEEEFDRLLKIGIWCIQVEPTIRPPMKKVVAMVEGTLAIPIPPCIVSCNDSSSYFLDIAHA
ncbi:G-type lectin S-receptor-like serine/threonine-protein kinase LECRK3 [Cannabis sativa]|uniref:G-type lectin S-receptor-like serine/threonine-protein kinase LECRK3 n=1 Tax=Cannabis sativa TaxID=3483 RepID=UPI0029CA5E54|nr:G-type lectin S-receptor-like serine/threonine-protein kinase LECRK3 [Cannabis sativa]